MSAKQFQMFIPWFILNEKVFIFDKLRKKFVVTKNYDVLLKSKNLFD